MTQHHADRQAGLHGHPSDGIGAAVAHRHGERDVLAGRAGGALAYGAFGLLLGVLVRGELEGLFLVIMVSLMDTFLQNPIGNPVANKDALVLFPSFAPTQLAVAGGFTDLYPGRYLLLALT